MPTMTPHLNGSETHEGLRNYVPHISAAIAFSLLFLAWVFLAHSPKAQPVQDAAHSITAQRNAQTLAFYGNGQLKVLEFYANPTETRAGSRALVCYGVSNAASVTIEPSL